MRSLRPALLIAFVSLTVQAFPSEVAPPSLAVTAKSALIIEERSGCVLFAKDADSKRFPASLTKILTTLLLLEKTLPDDKIIAPADVETYPESSLHLKPGETLTAREMAYALMLRSANDASYAVAVHLGGSPAGFAEMMNARAKELGCTSTNFVTPNGLHDPNHYTTARDIAKIAREAMKNPTFREIADTYKRQTVRSINQEDLWLVSKNKFLAWDATCDGIKTGYTKPAGHCFVGSATRNGFRVITVILAAEDWKADQKAMMDWAFKNYERQVAYAKNAKVAEAPLQAGAKPTVAVRIHEPVYYAAKKGVKHSIRTELKIAPELAAPVKEGDKLGTVVFKDGTGWFAEVPVYAAENVDVPALLGGGKANWGFLLFVVGMVGGSFLLKKKQSKFMKSKKKQVRRA